MLCSENKGADQLLGYREAVLRLCFPICKKEVFLITRLNLILYLKFQAVAEQTGSQTSLKGFLLDRLILFVPHSNRLLCHIDQWSIFIVTFMAIFNLNY